MLLCRTQHVHKIFVHYFFILFKLGARRAARGARLGIQQPSQEKNSKKVVLRAAGTVVKCRRI